MVNLIALKQCNIVSFIKIAYDATCLNVIIRFSVLELRKSQFNIVFPTMQIF